MTPLDLYDAPRTSPGRPHDAATTPHAGFSAKIVCWLSIFVRFPWFSLVVVGFCQPGFCGALRPLNDHKNIKNGSQGSIETAKSAPEVFKKSPGQLHDAFRTLLIRSDKRGSAAMA